MALAVASAVMLLGFLVVAPIAAPVSAEEDCAGVKISISVGCDKSQKNPIFAYAVGIINFVSILVIILVIGAIIFAGIMYMTANGDSSQTQKAVEMIRNSVIGLILYLLFGAILNFLIPGGLFSGASYEAPVCNAADASGCGNQSACEKAQNVWKDNKCTDGAGACTAATYSRCKEDECVKLGAQFEWRRLDGCYPKTSSFLIHNPPSRLAMMNLGGLRI